MSVEIRREQSEIIEWFIKNSVNYVVARSVDDLKAALVQWGIQTREAA